MPNVFRIVKKKYAGTALEGLGAKRYGGRWNSKGTPVVYASDIFVRYRPNHQILLTKRAASITRAAFAAAS